MILRKSLYVLGLMIFTISYSCNKPHHHNEITKIELARSGAWSDPGAVISIDSTLIYKYYGLLDSQKREKRDYYIGKVSGTFWDTLNRKFEKIKFKELSNIDIENVADVHYLELIIHWKNGRARTTKLYSIGKDSVINTLIWLNNSYKQIKLKRVNVAFKFETILYDLAPSINQVKFPPPVFKAKHESK